MTLCLPVLKKRSSSKGKFRFHKLPMSICHDCNNRDCWFKASCNDSNWIFLSLAALSCRLKIYCDTNDTRGFVQAWGELRLLGNHTEHEWLSPPAFNLEGQNTRNNVIWCRKGGCDTMISDRILAKQSLQLLAMLRRISTILGFLREGVLIWNQAILPTRIKVGAIRTSIQKVKTLIKL